MSDLARNTQSLVEEWMQSERNGVQFPVPLHEVWWIAGHRFKKDAIALVDSELTMGLDFLRSTVKTSGGKGGRPIKAVYLTMAALERLCLAAHTEQGKEVRELYRIAKNNWDRVKQVDPALAAQIELERLRNEGRKLEADKDRAALALIQFRHIITTTLPEPVQQKVLGYDVVKEVEYRDRIIHNEDLVRDGSTVNKTALCNRLGIVTRNGKPDYKRLNQYLESLKLPSDAWRLTAVLQDNYELSRDYLGHVEQRWINGDRQQWIGEQL